MEILYMEDFTDPHTTCCAAGAEVVMSEQCLGTAYLRTGPAGWRSADRLGGMHLIASHWLLVLAPLRELPEPPTGGM